jgi:hypothetical protein
MVHHSMIFVIQMVIIGISREKSHYHMDRFGHANPPVAYLKMFVPCGFEDFRFQTITFRQVCEDDIAIFPTHSCFRKLIGSSLDAPEKLERKNM